MLILFNALAFSLFPLKIPLRNLRSMSNFPSQSKFGPPPSSNPRPLYNVNSRLAAYIPTLPPDERLLMEAKLKDCTTMSALPHFARASMTRWPASSSMKAKCKIPLGVTIQPLAPVPVGKPPVPTVNFNPVGNILRCKRCLCYMNPFMDWESSGRSFICILCGTSTDIPSSYFAVIDEKGFRSDRFMKPELCQGSVDFIAPAEYMVRPPQPPVYLFVIEATQSSVRSGMLDVVVEALSSVIEKQRLAGGLRAMVGIMTFDTAVHFYHMDSSLQNPQMVVVGNGEDLFLPLPDDLLVNVADAERQIMALLHSLPLLFRDSKAGESCLGVALKAAHLAMQHVGGKMMVFLSSIPTIGMVDLVLDYSKEDLRLLNTDKEIEMLKRSTEGYKDLAVDCTKVQICIDLFVCASQFVDLSSLYPVTKFTGGDIHFFPSFLATEQGDRLKMEIEQTLMREQAWEGVMRIRVSKGWKVTGFFGHFYLRGEDLLVVPNMNADQTVTVMIEAEESALNADPFAAIQCALLYTSSDGERRIRVHTMSFGTTRSHNELMESVDAEEVCMIMANTAIETAFRGKLSDARNYLNSTIQQIVALVAPTCDSVKPLPLYTLGLLKSQLFRGTTDIQPDLRVFLWSRAETLPVLQMQALAFPRMISLLNFEDNMIGEEGPDNRIILPSSMPLTAVNLTQDGVYLMEDGFEMYMWVGRKVDSHWLQNAFGAYDIETLQTDSLENWLSRSSTQLGNKVRSIVTQIRADRRPPYMALKLCFPGSMIESKFFANLMEDRTSGMQISYAEFLQRIGFGVGMAPRAGMMPPPPTVKRVY